MSEYQIATLNINHEPVRVYVFQGRVPLHCGVCGKRLHEGDEYTRHQSPTRWSLSGHVFDDVEIGLRRTSTKPYTACSMCYGFTYQDKTPTQDTEAMTFVRLDVGAGASGELILEDFNPTYSDFSLTNIPVYEDPDVTEVRLPAIPKRPVWETPTQILPAVTRVPARTFLEQFTEEVLGVTLERKAVTEDEWTR